ncbi:MazG [Xanthomonas phage XAJ2]|uniref:MazG n=1 Tax=Xanthomonas phage XAJ2 TaxID=1775249 RepID=A0A1I9L2G6_9CAUD|nr:MazG [Xanthomonas phage XAJ2]
MTQAPFDYIAEANVTASNNYHGSSILQNDALLIIRNAVNALNELDRLKKAVYYGRNLESFATEAVGLSISSWPVLIDSSAPNRGELIMHSIIGSATEAGEKLELLLKTVANHEAFDEINFVEEIGDGQWYDAIGLGVLGRTFDEAQKLNILKLRKRFPNKFSEYDANNRDLFAERKILEEAPDLPPVEFDSKLSTDVRQVLIRVVPGDDGMGHEVYAKNVEDVEKEFSRLSQRIAELEK